MFKCQLCGTQVPRGVLSQLVVTRKRHRIYSEKWMVVPNTQHHRDHRVWRDLPRSRCGGKHQGKPRLIEIYVPVHVGWEIAEAKRACRPCVSRRA